PLVAAGAPKTFEISGQHYLGGGGGEPQAGQGHRPGRDDVVALQELDLVRGQRRVREDRHQPRLKGGKAERDIDEPALAADFAKQQFEDLAEGIDSRAAELIDSPGCRPSLETLAYRVGHVADLDRPETSF